MARQSTPDRGSDPNSGHNIVATLREFVDEEVAGIYTASMVIVVDVNEDTRRAEVELKADREVLVDNVPIASPFAGDGYGMVAPIQEGDEGLLLHAKQALEKQLAQAGEVEPEGDRRFTLEASVLLPMLWLDDMGVPDREAGEFTLAIQENGSIVLGDEATAKAVLNENAIIEYEDTWVEDTDDGSGSKTTETKEATIKDPGTSDVDVS